MGERKKDTKRGEDLSFQWTIKYQRPVVINKRTVRRMMMGVNVRIWLCLLIILSSGVESFVTPPIQQMTTRKHHRPSYSIDKSSYNTMCSNNIILSRVSKLSKRYRCSSRPRDNISLQSSHNENNEDTNAKSKTSTILWRQYYSI